MDVFLSELATEYAVFLGVWVKVAIGLIAVVLIYANRAGGEELRDYPKMGWFLFLFLSVPLTLSGWIIK